MHLQDICIEANMEKNILYLSLWSDVKKINDFALEPLFRCSSHYVEIRLHTFWTTSNFIKIGAVEVIQVEIWISVSPWPFHAQPVTVCKSIFELKILISQKARKKHYRDIKICSTDVYSRKIYSYFWVLPRTICFLASTGTRVSGIRWVASTLERRSGKVFVRNSCMLAY
jgi:hypothetical protein